MSDTSLAALLAQRSQAQAAMDNFVNSHASPLDMSFDDNIKFSQLEQAYDHANDQLFEYIYSQDNAQQLLDSLFVA